MAKKTKKKAAAKGKAGAKKAKAAGKGASKKKAKAKGKKKAAKAKSKKSAKSLAPRPVKTGKGASCHELGTEFIRLFNGGDIASIEKNLWSTKVVSVEGLGVNQAWHGLEAVRAKNDGWMSTHKIHGSTADGPYVGASGFAVRFSMDVEDTASGQRYPMNEVAVYTVDRGRIVREEFMYQV